MCLLSVDTPSYPIGSITHHSGSGCYKDDLILVYMGRNKFLQPHVPKWLTCVSFIPGINTLAPTLK